eukprot:scaffold74240_cov48-Phaeocystis_antarctica.AAC.2
MASCCSCCLRSRHTRHALQNLARRNKQTTPPATRPPPLTSPVSSVHPPARVSLCPRVWACERGASRGRSRYLLGRASEGDTGSIVSHAESTESAKLGPSDLRAAQLGAVSGAGAGAGWAEAGRRCVRAAAGDCVYACLPRPLPGADGSLTCRSWSSAECPGPQRHQGRPQTPCQSSTGALS